MKKSISIVLLLCMLVTLFSGMSFAVDEPAQPDETAPVEQTVPAADAEAEGRLLRRLLRLQEYTR